MRQRHARESRSKPSRTAPNGPASFARAMNPMLVQTKRQRKPDTVVPDEDPLDTIDVLIVGTNVFFDGE